LHALRLAVVVALLSWLGICGIALQVSHDLDGGERQRLALEHQHFQTQEVLTSIAATRSDLQDAETGQHGYLLTFDPVYLGAVERGSIASQGAIDHLAELTAGIPDLQRKVAQLRELAGRMLAELHQSVTLARNGERAAALAQIKSGSGRTLMDELRARLGDLERAVMDDLWSMPEPQTVRQVHEALSARRDLAYDPAVSFAEGLRRTSAAYGDNSALV